MKKVIFIAGEPSGDAIAYRLMKKLQTQEISFSGIGGSKMKSLGFQSIFHIKDISVIGFVEILKHLPKILIRIYQTIEHINETKPDLIVTFDSPGFCVAVVKKLRKQGYKGKIIHVVAPTVWAYKPKRAAKFAKIFDEICCLFPFEPVYFEKEGLKAHFIGNISIEDELANLPKATEEVPTIKTIAITLGSREAEVKKYIPMISYAIEIFEIDKRDYQFILPTLPHLHRFIEKYFKTNNPNAKITIISHTNAIYEAVEKCDIAICKSGTNTLQFISKLRPVIVYYSINWLSYIIMSKIVSIKFFNLINIMAGKMIIPELIQDNCSVINITYQVRKIIEKNSFLELQSETLEQLEKMKLPNEMPSEKLASIILNSLKS
ncbi:lipid-A-disaccharide synthase [Candidatus Deianiraea vastatrix]|uniref:Lipid-A-disaccharide synthase n=1 Tax=Candidatus Deianiraea vastatrix TaxID=2163644 RepID=A0A5B8XDS6_9RICK|nr:lipid-A-disaccharide synthase [Candidatus Deianiraea vastatrix]QED23462.1 Lipid-A-disaccharide synthase [Candidatus Deianiraea vastatrix]